MRKERKREGKKLKRGKKNLEIYFWEFPLEKIKNLKLVRYY
jgi:hypothetical protein